MNAAERVREIAAQTKNQQTLDREAREKEHIKNMITYFDKEVETVLKMDIIAEATRRVRLNPNCTCFALCTVTTRGYEDLWRDSQARQRLVSRLAQHGFRLQEKTITIWPTEPHGYRAIELSVNWR